MQFRDLEAQRLFGVALRVIGLLSLVRGLNDLAYVFFFAIGSLDVSINKSFPGTDLIYGVIFFFGGLYLLRGAPLLMNFSYPVIESEDDPEEEVREVRKDSADQ
jgi:hypothetical protein